jgi:hypothetical protein
MVPTLGVFLLDTGGRDAIGLLEIQLTAGLKTVVVLLPQK